MGSQFSVGGASRILYIIIRCAQGHSPTLNSCLKTFCDFGMILKRVW